MNTEFRSLVVHPGVPGSTERTVGLPEGAEVLPDGRAPDAVGLGLHVAPHGLEEPAQHGAVRQPQER